MGTHSSGMAQPVIEVWTAGTWSVAAVLQPGYGTAVSCRKAVTHARKTVAEGTCQRKDQS